MTKWDFIKIERHFEWLLLAVRGYNAICVYIVFSAPQNDSNNDDDDDDDDAE